MSVTTRRRLLVVSLVAALVAAPVTAGGTTEAIGTPQGGGGADAALAANNTTEGQVGTDALRGELNQSARVAPGGSQTLVDGGVYTAVVTVDVGKQGWFDLPEVSDPSLELDLTGDGARIVSLASGEDDYDDVPANVNETCATGCTVSSTNPFRAPNKTYASKHTVLVRFALNRSEPTENVTIEADPTPDADNGDEASVTYEVVESADSAAQLAEAAQAQARLAETYNRSYNRLFDIDWDSRADRYMMEEFTIVLNEAATSLVTGYADEVLGAFTGLKYANNLGTLQNAQSAYGMTTGAFGGATTVGKISRVNRRLYTLFEGAMDIEPIEDAGNTSFVLNELGRLSREEAEAWRNGNKSRVRDILHRKEYLLVSYTGHISASERTAIDERFDPAFDAPETPALHAQSRNQRQMAAHHERPTYEDYFDAVNEYAYGEFNRIRDVSLPMAREPEPDVTLDSSRAGLRERLANLSVGETTTVTLTASNGEKAGITSTQGYLSVAHADTLAVADVTQLSGDADVLVANTSVGESVAYRNGSRAPATAPLTDIYEPYDPDENNTYRLTVERTAESGDAWLTYRTAFEPIVHDDGESANFARYPTTEGIPARGPQGWAAFNISTAFETNTTNDTNRAPTARIDLSATTVEPGASLTVDGTNSSDPDGNVTTYEWAFDDGTEATGETAMHTYDSNGTYTVSLTVTDDDGANDTATATVTVEEPDRPHIAVESVETNSPVEVGTTLSVTARLRNTGDGGGTATGTARLSGGGSASKSALLPPGEDVSMVYALPTENLDPGPHTVTVTTPNETASANVTLEHALPPTFNVSIVETKDDPPGGLTDHDVFAGEPLRVVAEITNTDDYNGTQNVTLAAKRQYLADPVLRANASVGLEPGETVERTLSVPTDSIYPGWATSYEATVSVERPDGASDTVTGNIVPRTREFVVSLNDTNRPVEPGEPFEATVHIVNEGYATDTQDISLNLSGVGTDSQSIELVGEAHGTVTLSVPTEAGTTGRYTATVASANTSVSVPVNVFETPEQDIDSEQLAGDGTPNDPYVITNASALQAMEDGPDAHYVLGNDIDASETAAWNGGRGFDPVGESISSDGENFNGVLDGNGHTIHNLTVDRPDSRGVGLFGYVGWGEGSVRNVRLVGVNVTGRESVGGLAGYANTAVANASVSGRVVGDDEVGGLVGYLSYGGLVERSFTRGTVDGAGLVGTVYGSDYIGHVTQSYSLANATVGLVGTNAGCVTDAYYAGNASVLVADDEGARNNGTSADLYWDEAETDAGSANGSGLTTAQMTGIAARTNMTGLDFGDVWTVRSGYPALMWQVDPANRTADIAYRELHINRSEPQPADPVAVAATVVNRGTERGTFNATLSVNGSVTARENGTLAPGERRTVRFVARFESTGAYELRVGGPNGSTAPRELRVVPPHAELRFDPANGTVAPGDPLAVNVTMDTGETSVYGATTVVHYDPDVLNATGVEAGGVLASDGAGVFVATEEIDAGNGTLTLAVSRRNTTAGVSGTGALATLTFEAADGAPRNATTALAVGDATTLSTAAETAVPYEARTGAVTVAEPWPEVGVSASLVDSVLNAGAETTLTARASANVPVERVGYSWSSGATTRAVEGEDRNATAAFELAPGESTWNGSGYGTRTVTVTAATDTVVTNETLTFPVYLAGDATGDGEVDVFDAVAVGTAWGGNATTSPGRYTAAGDLTGDGKVGVADAAVLGREWQASAG